MSSGIDSIDTVREISYKIVNDLRNKLKNCDYIDARVGAHHIIEGSRETDTKKLLQKVINGIFIGILWYLYPVYGLEKPILQGLLQEILTS